MPDRRACRILGIDPGSRAAGYGVVDVFGQQISVVDHGVIRLDVAQPLHRRLVALHAGITRVVVAHDPTEVAIEQVFTARNPRSALVLGHARGVLLLAAADRCEVFEYSARAVKKAVAGYGQAEKEQIAQMVCRLLGLARKPPQDAADALAIALCHAHSRQLGRRVAAADALSHRVRP